ncbi:MAG: ABC-F family ATP-binding cassette domain-containing protein, partial [Bacteroidia bacterium]|nr:ABC-F family ATP-binding cassette domain-containing protein [Bacteroidia bacterium]
QNPLFPAQKTVADILFDASNPVLQAIHQYQLAIEAGSPEKISQAMDTIDKLSAWDFETKVKQILTKLEIHFLQTPFGKLSGGQQKRLALAKVLIDEPDFLLLDEPTNHLDIQMVEWLEQYLVKSNATVLLITHDRYFLEAVTNELLELSDGKLYRFVGTYAQFLEKKAERIQAEQSSAEKAANLLRKELDWMRRQPKARTTKSKAREEAFYELEAKAKYVSNDKQVQLSMQMQRLGKKILEAQHLCKQYGNTIILQDFSYTFRRKERVGIVGKNGTGKSTFLRLLTGQETPDSGNISLGETVVFGYYEQTGLQVEPHKTVLEVVSAIADVIEIESGRTISVSQLLTRFLFPPPIQHTPVGQLSGGELRRLYLLTVLLKNPNFLILDEPTNDLDLDTLNVLEEFLQEYEGCLIIVSHDRYFLDKLVEHLFIFEGSGKIQDFNGNYTEYRELKKAEEQFTEPPKIKSIPQLTPKTNTKRKLSYKEQRELEQTEARINWLEQRKVELELALQNTDHQVILETAKQLELVNQEIDELTYRWLELSEYA